jgi:integrase
MVRQGLNRRVVNHRVRRVVQVFRWGVAEELVPVPVYQALRAVPGLAAGRSPAPEPIPVRPVEPAHVAAVLPHVLPEVAAMVELQRHTGMPPGEVCGVRPRDVDRTGPVWGYRPDRHKTSYRGRDRVVPLGPRAQAVLAPWLDHPGVAPYDYVFSPRRAMAAFRARQRAARKTRVQPSQRDRRRPKSRWVPGEQYTTQSYGRAIAAACEKAGVPPRSPHHLRHAAATLYRRHGGLEAAQVILGHAHAGVTEVYAERNLDLALRVAAEVG